jgi:hypothetical protein
VVRRIHPPSGDAPTTPVLTTRPAPAQPTRPQPRRSTCLVPWLVVGAVALLVLGGASAWSAVERGPDAPRQHLALAVPTAAAPLPIVQGTIGGAADRDPIAVAPRPTAVRASAPTVEPAAGDAAPREAAKTVAVAAPPPDDAPACATTVPRALRPRTCPPAPPRADPPAVRGTR